MNKNTSRLILYITILCSILLLQVSSNNCVSASEKEKTQTIRVGYYSMPDYQEYNNGSYSGYAYDYLQEIA